MIFRLEEEGRARTFVSGDNWAEKARGRPSLDSVPLTRVRDQFSSYSARISDSSRSGTGGWWLRFDRVQTVFSRSWPWGVISGEKRDRIFNRESLESFLERSSRQDRGSAIFARKNRRKGGFVLRTGTEDLAASIATAGELGVVTIPAVDLVHLATELFVHQGHPAPVAQETGLVPMLILVRQILQTRRSFSRDYPSIERIRNECDGMRWNGGGKKEEGEGDLSITRRRLKETKLRRAVYLLQSTSCNFDAARRGV